MAKFPTIVLIHGMPGSTKDYKYLIPELNKVGGGPYDVLAVDTPGFGDAPPLQGGKWTHERQAQSVMEYVIDKMGGEEKAREKRVVLVGHSHGAHIAAHGAEMYSEMCAGMALIAPNGVSRHWNLFYHLIMKVLLMLHIIPPLRGVVVGALYFFYKKLLGFRHCTWKDAETTTHYLPNIDFRGYQQVLERLTLPTLVASADDDRLVPSYLNDELIKYLPPGPRIRFSSGGHNIQKFKAKELAKNVVLFASKI